jgi:hypothetical protein
VKAGCVREGVVVLVYGRAPCGADEHGFKNENGQRRRVCLFVKRPRFLGHLPIVSVFRILEAVAFRKTARQFVRQRAQDKLRHHAQLFGSELRLHPLEDFREDAVPELVRNGRAANEPWKFYDLGHARLLHVRFFRSVSAPYGMCEMLFLYAKGFDDGGSS